MNSQFLTRHELAQSLRVSLRKVDQLIKQKQIASVTIGRRRLISHESLTRFVQQKTTGGEE